MTNELKISLCRFHVKDSSKLLLVGNFEKNSMENNQIKITLDGRDTSYTVDDRKKVVGGARTRTGNVVTKDFFLWISLPENWAEKKKLCVFNIEEDKKKKVYTMSVGRIKHLQNQLPRYIESYNMKETGFVISGWYIGSENTQVRFYDESNQELIPDFKTRTRKDVVRAYPECTEKDAVGFEASYHVGNANRVKVVFEDGNKLSDCVVEFQPSLCQRVQKKVAQVCEKTELYYHQYGFWATVLRMLDKLTHRESISYKKWLRRHYPSQAILDMQRQHEFDYQPKISIVIPLYKTPQKYLDELVQSVKAQTYANWELCLSDGSGENSPMTEILKAYEAEDERIKVAHNEKQLHISDNTNAALAISTGDFIAFADHDDLLAPHALYECVSELNEDPTIEILYSDEDKIDMNGKEHFMPHMKPDFNIDLLRSGNYICHLFVVKREIYDTVGNLRHEYDGAQDFDFTLRCVETSKHIKHIPKILYHWRAHKDSTAENPESKNYAYESGARAAQAHFDRLGIKATVVQSIHKGVYRTKYELEEQPLVSIIIPNKDHIADLKKCISSIEKKSTYHNYEIIVVENNSTEPETFEYYKTIEKECSKVKVLYWQGTGFNYPAINNYGVEHSKGDYVLLLNNDTEVVNDDWLEELLGYCMRADVGAVGARMYYEDGTIQHAGVIVGLGGVAGHAFAGSVPEDPGYCARIHMAQNYSAVTAACMLIKKAVYEQVGGLDEKFAVAFNDVDLCLKIREAGYLIVYNPYVELNHYESKSRGFEDTKEKVQRFNSEVELFKTRWHDFLQKGDPCYSPNLTLDKHDFSLNVHANKVK